MIELFFGLVCGMIIGALIFRMMLHRAAQQASDELTNLLTVLENLQETMIPARVEEHEGVFYVYNTRDNSFLAQGTTVQELRDAIDQRWKNVQVFVSEGDQAVIDRLRATGGSLDPDRA